MLLRPDSSATAQLLFIVDGHVSCSDRSDRLLKASEWAQPSNHEGVLQNEIQQLGAPSVKAVCKRWWCKKDYHR